MFKVHGGGKRAKQAEETTPSFVAVPTPSPNDIQEVKTCIEAEAFDLEKIINDMSLSKAEDFYTAVIENTQTGNMAVFTKAYLPFVPVIGNLQDSNSKQITFKSRGFTFRSKTYTNTT